MIKIAKYAITKAHIASLPEQDRRAFLLSGHAFNQLGMWLRLIALSTNESPVNPIVARLRAAQSHMLLRSLYASLYETWVWLDESSTRRHIESEHLPSCTPEQAAAYRSLKQTFEESKLLGTLRNQYSSHFPTKAQLESAFAYAPAGEDWAWYMCEELTNSFWGSSEVVIGYGSVALAEVDDPGAGLQRILGEAMEVANKLQDLLGAIQMIVWDKHIDDVDQPEAIFELEGAPAGSQFELPYLLEPPLMKRQ